VITQLSGNKPYQTRLQPDDHTLDSKRAAAPESR
jgi:hypothetical protein